MIIVGIDPGIEPSVAFLTEDGGRGVISSVKVSKFSGERTVHRIDFGPDLTAALKECMADDAVVACVERVGAMPRQGVASVAHFCEAFGIIRGILIGLEIPTVLVTPGKWKKDLLEASGYDMGKELDPKDRKKHQKAVAAQFVHATYPSVSLIRKGCRTEDHNAAEAICIATWRARCSR
jgi:crossover junction endodeoxyribonuclease RuvC